MGSRVVLAHLAPNKRLVSPSYCLTFMPHVIFVKKRSKGRWALRVGGLASLAKNDHFYLVYFWLTYGMYFWVKKQVRRIKVLDSPNWHLILRRHGIFFKKTPSRGRWGRGLGGLTLLIKKEWVHHVCAWLSHSMQFSLKKQVRGADVLEGWVDSLYL